MPFKIVQTFENGNIVLTCVPHHWELNGVLYWPRNKNTSQTSKLQKDEDSHPDDTWKRIQCGVKRRYIKTYQEATNEIDLMSNNSETEPDEDLSRKKRHSDVPKLSYNIMAEEILQNVKHDASSTTTVLDNNALMSEELQVMMATEENTSQATATPCGTLAADTSSRTYVVVPENNERVIDTIESDIKTIKEDIKTLMEIQNTILNNQNVIHDSLNSIMLQVTQMHVTNEEFIKKCITDKQNQSSAIKKIKDLKDLEEFENKLIESDYREDLERNLSMFCTKGIGQGTTIAYAIIDVIFERQFFKSCSWTGASRSQNEPTGKICFKGFPKTIRFFFDVIQRVDSSFRLTDCHKFFKTILRNADQRCKTEPKRTSTKRNRVNNRVKNTPLDDLPTMEIDIQPAGNPIGVDDFTGEVFV